MCGYYKTILIKCKNVSLKKLVTIFKDNYNISILILYLVEGVNLKE